MKRGSQLWKTLPEPEKKAFQVGQEAALRAYKAEKEEKRKAALPPPAPRNPFALFLSEKQEELMKKLEAEQHQPGGESSQARLMLPRVTKEAGDLWQALGRAEKEKYEARADAEEKKFKADMSEWTKNHPEAKKKKSRAAKKREAEEQKKKGAKKKEEFRLPGPIGSCQAKGYKRPARICGVQLCRGSTKLATTLRRGPPRHKAPLHKVAQSSTKFHKPPQSSITP